MAREHNRLRPSDIDKPGPKYRADGGGLYLRVDPQNGGKSWVFRYRRDGRLREAGLGPVHTVNLSGARKKALRLRNMLLDGTDPVAQRKTERAQRQLEVVKTITFKTASDTYFDAHQAGWSQKHAAQWRQSLDLHVHPHIGQLPVAAIDTGLIIRVLESIWNEKPETGSRVRGRIESVLDWAASRGYRDSENPARWKGRLQYSFQKKSKLRPVSGISAYETDRVS